MSIPAGWYADSTNPEQLRWWDGEQWTEHVTPATAASATGGDPSADTTAMYPASATTSTTQTTRNFDAAKPKPKRTGLWIGLGAGALVLILLIGAGIFAVGARLLGSFIDGVSAGQEPGPIGPGTGEDPRDGEGDDTGDGNSGDVSAQLMNPLLPAGFALDSDNPLEGSDSAAGFWSIYVDTIDPVPCTPLTALEPLVATDADSTDTVTELGSWVDEDGAASLSASVRQTPSPENAEGLLNATEATVEACASGYAGEGFASESIVATDFDYPSDAIDEESWSESGVNISETESVPWVYEAVDIQRGNLVVRGTCFQSAESADAAVCSEFFTALAADLDAL